MSITSFIPTIWSARLLMHLDNALVAKEFFNTDYEGEITDQGDTVRINQIGNITSFKYVRNQDMTPPQTLNTGAMDLVIDQADAFNFQIDDIDRVQARTNLMDRAMQRSAFRLADDENTYLFNKLATDGGNQLTGVDITNGEDAYALVVELRSILTKKNVPTTGRKLAVPPDFVSFMLRDERFTGTGGTLAESQLVSGFVTRAVGFDIYEVNNLPTGKIIATHQIQGTYANQIAKTEAFRMEKRFADGLKGLNVYGAKVLIPDAVAVATVTLNALTA